jgi:putative transcription factor
MEECEICGKKTSDVYIVNVEEVELRVCTKCAQGKKIVSKVLEKGAKQGLQKNYQRERKNDFEQLIEDYGAAVKQARESMKLPIKVLAEMLNEKETFLLRIEEEKAKPSEELRKKLEKALAIRLTEVAGTETENTGSRGGGDKATLGDFMKKR